LRGFVRKRYGRGIPEDIYQRLGTPFVTSKENGTGLGIPICFGSRSGMGRRSRSTQAPEATFRVRFAAAARDGADAGV
jgi:nitrogen-specific signal transduction histidine kinase